MKTCFCLFFETSTFLCSSFSKSLLGSQIYPVAKIIKGISVVKVWFHTLLTARIHLKKNQNIEEIGTAVSFILTCGQLKVEEAEVFISATDPRQCTKCLGAGPCAAEWDINSENTMDSCSKDYPILNSDKNAG